MLIVDDRNTYQIIQKDIGSADLHKSIRKEPHIKKLVCCWVPHNLIETKNHSVSKSIRIEALKFSLFCDSNTSRDFGGNLKPTMGKRKQGVRKVM